MSVNLGRFQKVLARVPKAIRDVRKDGLLGASRFYRYCVYERFRDWRLGIETCGRMGRKNLNCSDACLDVQEQLHRSLQDYPRLLRVAHMRPRNQSNAFEGCDWLTKECELPTGWQNEVTFVVYRSNYLAKEHIDYNHCELATQLPGDVVRRSPK